MRDGYAEKVDEENAKLAAEEELLRQRYMESAFKDNAESSKGAKGAYQIVPVTHDEYINATGSQVGAQNGPLAVRNGGQAPKHKHMLFTF